MRSGWGSALSLMASLIVADAALADESSCREWRREHCEWSARAISRYLGSAPQRAIDEAVFEVLQRETYLSSCESPVASSRRSLVGWRMVDRTPDEYGSIVLEALLEKAGFDVALRDRLGRESLVIGRAAPPRRIGARRRGYAPR